MTVLTVRLTSYPTQHGAAAGYAALAGPGTGSHRIAGLGHAGATQSDGTVYVLSGHQVLVVRPTATVAGNNYVAAQGKSSQSLQTVFYGPALTAARVLARHMSGHAPSGPHFYLPPGALSPCIGTAASFHKATHKAVTMQPVVTQSPPAQQCDFTIAGQPFQTTTYTGAQARSAISTGSPQAVFAAERTRAGGRRVKSATVGPIKAFMVQDTDWQVDFLVHGFVAPRAADTSRGTGPTARPATRAGDALIETLNGYTFTVSYDDCFNTMNYELGGVLGPTFRGLGSAGDAARAKLTQDMKDWCRGLTSQGG